MLFMRKKEEEPRLYSTRWKPKELCAPADDVIAPEHAKAHELLIRWGLWARRRAPSTNLASIERLYSRAVGTPPSTAPLSADPKISAVEMAVVAIIDPQARRMILMLYVFRCSSYTICRSLKLAFDAYPAATHRVRQMIVDLVQPGVLR